MKNSIVKNFLHISSGTFISLLIGVLTTPLLTRLIEPEKYGQYSMFVMYGNIALMVLCLGLDQSLVRYFYKHDSIQYKSSLLKKCIFIPLGLLFILGLLLALLWFPLLGKYYGNHTLIIILFYVHVLGLMLNRFSTLILRLQYKTKMYSILNIWLKLSFVMVALCLFFFINNNYYLLLILASISSYYITSIIAIIKERKIWLSKKNNYFSTINNRNIILYGLPFIVSLGITTLFQSIDKISLNYYSTYKEIGIYSSAMNLVHVFGIIQNAFNALWGPMAIEHYEKNEKDTSFYTQGNQIITILMFFMGASLILFKDIFALLLGEKYRLAAYILPFLTFNPIMYTISETTVTGITFKEKSSLHIYIALVSCIVNIIGNTFLIPIIGAKGAAISTGISYIMFFTLRTLLSNKCYYVDYRLKQFYTMTFVMAIYALYSTFYKFSLLSILGYITFLLLLLLLYRNIIKSCLSYIHRWFINKKA